MSTTRSDDTAVTSSTTNVEVEPVLRLTESKSNSRFLGSFWKLRNSVEKNSSKNSENADRSTEIKSSTNISNSFFKNMKKRLHIKNFSFHKVKQKMRGKDSLSQYQEVECVGRLQYENRMSLTGIRYSVGPADRRAPMLPDAWLCIGVDISVQSAAEACWESYSTWGERCYERDLWRRQSKAERQRRLMDGDQSHDEVSGLKLGNLAEPQSTIARSFAEDDGIDAHLGNEDSRGKVDLAGELLKLSKYGWYWGPISGDEADSKLISEPDGAFLVRDSSDDRYLLTLSFKALGRLLHARMEHSGGYFSLCNRSEDYGFTSVAALIDHSMNSSQSAVFCYSRPRFPGHPSVPVRLTKPVSRFTQVRSLQYLCRFVIRQTTRLDNIHKLPLPKTIRGYIEEAHY